MHPRYLLLLVLALPTLSTAQQIVVSPYLQLASPTEMTVRWETEQGSDTAVDYGPTAALGSMVVGESWASGGGTVLHRAVLTGLSPGATVHYVASSGSWASASTSFVVPTAAPDSVRLVAVSDMQRDSSNPDVFADLIADGVLPWMAANTDGELPDAVQAMLVPGDLVATGWSYPQWEEQFFTPAAPLMSRVPTYPVPGNHENDTDYFFDYFDLPLNGTPGYEEHWWSHDIGSVRVLGLDSNGGYLIDEQIQWLEGVLADSCADATVDFVIAQLHHPFKSELWTPGENPWTGLVVNRLEDWTSSCGKPSVHLFGHTHGYSRGQSRDHDHFWINVASAGGAIDYWGEWPQRDYEEFVVSQDEWGFVVMEMEGLNSDPTMRVRRIGRGNRDIAPANDTRDDVTVRTNNGPPESPSALAPQGDDAPRPEETTLVASAFVDPDGDLHGSTQWQIATSCDGFDTPSLDRWVQHRNEYLGSDLNADVDLTSLFVDTLASEVEYCWRVRYRDQSLRWSPWSAGQSFTTARASFTDNLLDNPGAEDGVAGWTVIEGEFESVQGGDCDAGEPHSGERFFAVGGVCDVSAFGAASQSVPLGLWSSQVNAGRATARLRGWMSDWGGDDEPAMQMIFLDGSDGELGRGVRMAMTEASWQQFTDTAPVPVGTARIEVRLEGTRNAGNDNDSYVDDLELQLQFAAETGDDDDAAGDDDDDDSADPVADGCGCAASGASPSAAWSLWVLCLVALSRRREPRRA